MDTKIIQLTSGKGPAECCLAVALALKELIEEARASGLEHQIIERYPGEENGTLSSAMVKVYGKGAAGFAKSWEGSLLWIIQSPYRKFHKRKNWFIGISVYDSSVLPEWKEAHVVFQTMRSSGPGGQNVNKVETAVRATYKGTDLQVMVNESRSQLQNKKIAMERLHHVFLSWQMTVLQKDHQAKWQNHHELERGNPARTYAGKDFIKERNHGTK